MTVYVLVHGAWGGAFGYRRVRPLLHAAGHEVFTPGLTGLGHRAHLASPLVNLSTHVRDVVNLVRYEDLTDIVLVGHSYGGMVVTGAVDRLRDRIAHLVYVDAFVPRDGQSLYDLTGQRAGDLDGPGGDGWAVPPLPRDFGSPEESAWTSVRRRPHPIGCFTEPVSLREPLEEYGFALTYVRATADPSGSPGDGVFQAAADRARSDPRWRYREIATDHLIPAKEPGALSEILLEPVR